MAGSNTVPTLTAFTSGDLVISISGDGDGSGTYTDNQASPITLEELTTAGAIVGQLVLPQSTTILPSGATEYAISGEYGSSSEGTLELSADGQSLVIAGYGINDVTYNTGGAAVYGNAALAQTTSLKGGTYTAVPRVIADISYNGTVDTTTALYNVFNTNNPRSVATVNGTSFYITGQGVKGDTTQGVFQAEDGASSATTIDTSTDTRTAEIYNGVLYVSRDSTQGTGGTSNIGSYGATLPGGATADTPLSGINGTVQLTAAQENTVNASAAGTTVHLSPENFFFANATTLYVADGGNPKEGGLGDGGLQKWTYASGTWTLDYTLSAGLGLVADTAGSGTTGLIGLTGVVVGNTVQLYATNSTLGDLDQTYLFGITDSLTATVLPTSETFTTLVTAAADSNIRGIAFAPSASAATPTNVTVPTGPTQSGLTVTSGSTLGVQNGGSIAAATILSGGTATISSGGTDTGSTIGHGGMETVLGSATGDQVEGTQLVSAATAAVSSETVYNGGAVDLLLKGVTASAITVDSGGTLAINGNATATNTVISGGVVDLQSAKAVLAGAVTFTGPGTLKLDAVLSAGYGVLGVISGFAAGDVVDDVSIGGGAVLTTVVTSGTTVATLTNSTTSQSFTFAGSVAGSLSAVSDGGTGTEIAFSAPAPTTTTVSSGVTSTGLTVTSGSTLTVLSGGTIVSATIQSSGTATISGVDTGSTILAGGTETVLGSATGDQVYGTQIVSAATAVANAETVHSGGVVDLFLKGVTASGLVVQNGGTVNVNGNATATNTVMSGGVFNLQSPKAVIAGSFTFAGPATLEATAVVSAGYGDLAVISGFTAGDIIDETVIGAAATLSGAVTSGNTVETITSGSTSEAFTFAGTYAAGYFTLTADGGSGVEITAAGTPCYCRGTLILTAEGEKPVEDLRIGDRLAVLSGAMRPLRWIGRRSYGGSFAAGNRDVLPVVIRAGALGGGVPRRDLSVSPLHAMFLDGVLVPAAALVNGASIVQAGAIDRVEYFHLELDSHDVLLAEGAPSESFVDDDSRGMFHNAAEYRVLYPAAARTAAVYCAPRVEDGPVLAEIRQRLAAQAGLTAGAIRPGPLQGRLDEAGGDRIRGWARDATAPGAPVILRISDNGVVLATVAANVYRVDLERAGIGNGRHGFDFVVPGGLSPAMRHVIEVQRATDGAVLANSPWVLDAAPLPVIAAAPASPAEGHLDEVTRERIVGWAYDPAMPDAPVAVQILDNGLPIARVLANGYRTDLAAAGIGAGWHLFDVVIPGGLSPLTRHVIQLRRERDGAELPGSPLVIEAADSFGTALEQAVAQAVAAIGSDGERQRVLSFIAAQADVLLQQQAEAESGRAARGTARRLKRAGSATSSAAPGLRALVIDERLPVAGRDAGSQAVLSHIAGLQALGYAVSFAAADEIGAASAALDAAGVRVCRAPFYASVEEVLRRQADGFDVVYLHRASIASRYLTLARGHMPRGRILYSVADLHHVRLERQAAVEERPELLGQSRRIRLEEYRAAWAADAVITHSAAEAALLRRAVPEADVHVVGWALPVRKRPAAFAARHGVGFIGNYGHAPNGDAARYLVEAVMPLVWQADPALPCILAGHGMPPALRALAGPQVIIAGHVADLAADLFDRVRLTTAPLRYGAGLKGKVLESYAAGVPCAMSPVAAEGLAFDGAPIGADAAALAALILRLHGNQTANRTAVRAGQAVLRRDYAADAITEGLRRAIAGSAPALRAAG